MNLQIDQQQLQNEIDQLASFSSEPSPVVTRVVFSPADQQARGYVNTLFKDALACRCGSDARLVTLSPADWQQP